MKKLLTFFQNVDIISDSDDAIARMITLMKEANEVIKECKYVFYRVKQERTCFITVSFQQQEGV